MHRKAPRRQRSRARPFLPAGHHCLSPLLWISLQWRPCDNPFKIYYPLWVMTQKSRIAAPKTEAPTRLWSFWFLVCHVQYGFVSSTKKLLSTVSHRNKCDSVSFRWHSVNKPRLPGLIHTYCFTTLSTQTTRPSSIICIKYTPTGSAEIFTAWSNWMSPVCTIRPVAFLMR